MDNKLSVQVKKLIELDRQAVDLAKQREAELKELEQEHKKELERINNSLQQAKDEAKGIYVQTVENARKEAETLEKEINQRIEGVSQGLSKAVSGLPDELWGKILDSIK